MSYNQRTAARIEQWFWHCRFKPIHVCILERVFNFAWRSRSSASLAAEVKGDRSTLWWKFHKELGGQNRNCENILHRRPGPQERLDYFFEEVWGDSWTARLKKGMSQEAWKALRPDFVTSTCEKLGLKNQQGQHIEVKQLGSKHAGRDAGDIVLPLPLKRDELWTLNSPSVQLEFVVDNQLVAGLANVEVRCTCERYRLIVSRIRQHIRSLMTKSFDYKAGFLQPVDWRPREFNKAADLIADHVLDKRSDVSALDIKDLINRLGDIAAIQIFSDGGFDGHYYGSMAFVIVGYQILGSEWRRHILGYRGILVKGAVSAFQFEIGALDLAVDAALSIAYEMPEKTLAGQLTTQRTPLEA